MRAFLFATALLAAMVQSSFAHDTWIISRPSRVKSGGAVELHITSGMKFPAPETTPDPSRLKSCEWRVGGRRGSLSDFEKADSSLVVKGRVATDGVAVVYVEFNPKDIDLTPEEVAEYLDEIGATESVRRAWKDAGPDAKFHETFTKHAKTYLRIGDSGDANGFVGPVGFSIDLLPERDPTSLKPGETFAIKAIRGGQELEGFAVTAVRGQGKTTMQRTSKSGMVAFQIDAPGWWLIRCTELRHKADGTWESDFTTLTFFVSND